MVTTNQSAFLQLIAWSEGTSRSPITKCDGFDVIVTGIDGTPEVFTDFSSHPFAHRAPKLINSHGLVSTAAGRYQILYKFWPHYQAQLNLPDFSPASQDAYAIQIIRETGALLDIEAGNIQAALARVAHLWASLPGADYAGQNMQKLSDLVAQYRQSGGVLAA